MARILSWALVALAGMAVVGGAPAPAADLKIAVFPQSLDFGNLAVGQSRTRVVTIFNLGTQTLTVSAVALSADSGAEFTIASPPATPFDLAARRSKRVKVTFTPSAEAEATATLEIASNDPANGLLKVALSGAGIPANSLGIDKIIAFFDESASPADTTQPATLQGRGGRWPWFAELRLQWMRNLLAAAQYYDNQGYTDWAWVLLVYSYWYCDGEPWPQDLVEGDARAQLADMIWQAIDAYMSQ